MHILYIFVLLYCEVDVVCCESYIFLSEKHTLHGAVLFIEHRLSINDLFPVCYNVGRKIEPLNRNSLQTFDIKTLYCVGILITLNMI